MTIATTINEEKDVLTQNLPIVSVVVATYRRKEPLYKALVSLTKQTYSNIQIVVVDDNADCFWNKEVEYIINKVISETNINIIYIQNSENKGSAETRNIGIESTTGEYITFLDDDDCYLPDKIEKQLKHMLQNKSDYSITDLWLYDEKDNLIEKRNRYYIKDTSSVSLLKYHLMYHITGTDTMMFKKKYIVKIGMFSKIDVGDEFYLMLKAIDGEGTFSYLPENYVKAYVHSSSVGLSSGDSKVNGENALYEYKKKYFVNLTSKEIRYIKMRHYAVLAYAEFRRKKFFSTILNLCSSVLSAPIAFIQLFLNRK